ncbi:hypothetical protein GcM1_244116 [Golovinomyces cichoracearum]|uniref:Proteophosphoglycan ppg4 n=1 Tax=Golovinomyces cichoracearum TaxID=62708 RepID=A0A420IG29_9PEZI|nr:hypothetical protein GcM1_244116 [Golovinomyces cichoracearum]
MGQQQSVPESTRNYGAGRSNTTLHNTSRNNVLNQPAAGYGNYNTSHFSLDKNHVTTLNSKPPPNLNKELPVLQPEKQRRSNLFRSRLKNRKAQEIQIETDKYDSVDRLSSRLDPKSGPELVYGRVGHTVTSEFNNLPEKFVISNKNFESLINHAPFSNPQINSQWLKNDSNSAQVRSTAQSGLRRFSSVQELHHSGPTEQHDHHIRGTRNKPLAPKKSTKIPKTSFLGHNIKPKSDQRRQGNLRKISLPSTNYSSPNILTGGLEKKGIRGPKIQDNQYSVSDSSLQQQRTVTPNDLEYRHIGAYKLGSLKITNGEASPAPSPERDRVISKRSQSREGGAIRDNTNNRKIPNQEVKICPWSTNWASPLSKSHEMNLDNSEKVQPRQNLDSKDVDYSSLCFQEISTPHEIDLNSIQNYNESIQHSVISPFSFVESSGPSPRFQTTKLNLSVRDRLFDEEPWTPTVLRHSPQERRTYLLSDDINDEDYLNNTTPLTKADSGYRSNVSLRSNKKGFDHTFDQEESPKSRVNSSKFSFESSVSSKMNYLNQKIDHNIPRSRSPRSVSNASESEKNSQTRCFSDISVEERNESSKNSTAPSTSTENDHLTDFSCNGSPYTMDNNSPPSSFLTDSSQQLLPSPLFSRPKTNLSRSLPQQAIESSLVNGLEIDPRRTDIPNNNQSLEATSTFIKGVHSALLTTVHQKSESEQVSGHILKDNFKASQTTDSYSESTQDASPEFKGQGLIYRGSPRQELECSFRSNTEIYEKKINSKNGIASSDRSDLTNLCEENPHSHKPVETSNLTVKLEKISPLLVGKKSILSSSISEGRATPQLSPDREKFLLPLVHSQIEDRDCFASPLSLSKQDLSNVSDSTGLVSELKSTKDVNENSIAQDGNHNTKTESTPTQIISVQDVDCKNDASEQDVSSQASSLKYEKTASIIPKPVIVPTLVATYQAIEETHAQIEKPIPELIGIKTIESPSLNRKQSTKENIPDEKEREVSSIGPSKGTRYFNLEKNLDSNISRDYKAPRPYSSNSFSMLKAVHSASIDEPGSEKFHLRIESNRPKRYRRLSSLSSISQTTIGASKTSITSSHEVQTPVNNDPRSENHKLKAIKQGLSRFKILKPISAPIDKSSSIVEPVIEQRQEPQRQDWRRRSTNSSSRSASTDILQELTRRNSVYSAMSSKSSAVMRENLKDKFNNEATFTSQQNLAPNVIRNQSFIPPRRNKRSYPPQAHVTRRSYSMLTQQPAIPPIQNFYTYIENTQKKLPQLDTIRNKSQKRSSSPLNEWNKEGKTNIPRNYSQGKVIDEKLRRADIDSRETLLSQLPRQNPITSVKDKFLNNHSFEGSSLSQISKNRSVEESKIKQWLDKDPGTKETGTLSENNRTNISDEVKNSGETSMSSILNHRKSGSLAPETSPLSIEIEAHNTKNSNSVIEIKNDIHREDSNVYLRNSMTDKKLNTVLTTNHSTPSNSILRENIPITLNLKTKILEMHQNISSSLTSGSKSAIKNSLDTLPSQRLAQNGIFSPGILSTQRGILRRSSSIYPSPVLQEKKNVSFTPLESSQIEDILKETNTNETSKSLISEVTSKEGRRRSTIDSVPQGILLKSPPIISPRTSSRGVKENFVLAPLDPDLKPDDVKAVSKKKLDEQGILPKNEQEFPAKKFSQLDSLPSQRRDHKLMNDRNVTRRSLPPKFLTKTQDQELNSQKSDRRRTVFSKYDRQYESRTPTSLTASQGSITDDTRGFPTIPKSVSTFHQTPSPPFDYYLSAPMTGLFDIRSPINEKIKTYRITNPVQNISSNDEEDFLVLSAGWKKSATFPSYKGNGYE